MKHFNPNMSKNVLFTAKCNVCGSEDVKILPVVKYEEDYKTPSKMFIRFYCPDCGAEHEVLIYE